MSDNPPEIRIEISDDITAGSIVDKSPDSAPPDSPTSVAPRSSFYEQAKRNSRVLVEDTLSTMLVRRAADTSNDLQPADQLNYQYLLPFSTDVVKVTDEKPLKVYNHEGSALVPEIRKEDGTEILTAEPNTDIIQQMVKKVNKPLEQGYPLFDRRRLSSNMGRESFYRMKEGLTRPVPVAEAPVVEESDKEISNAHVKRPMADDILARRETHFAEFERNYRKSLAADTTRDNRPSILKPRETGHIKQIIENAKNEVEDEIEMEPVKTKKKVVKSSKKTTTTIVLDSHIIEQSQHQLPSQVSAAALEPKVKPRMAFSKASTGRLGQTKPNIPPIPLKHPQDQEVMLVGQRVGNEIIKVKTDSRIHHHIPEPMRTLEPIYFKEERTKKIVALEKNESEIDSAKQIEKKQEVQMDTGVFRHIVDVDAMIPHFAAILEAKKKNLKDGIEDESKITALVEAPHLPPPVELPVPLLDPTQTPLLPGATPATPTTPAAEGPLLVENADQGKAVMKGEIGDAPSVAIAAILAEPSVSYNLSSQRSENADDEVRENDQRNQTPRPLNSARIRFQNDLFTEMNNTSKRSLHSAKSAKSSVSSLSKSNRPIKSASTRATSASGTGSTPSSSCTCSDSSCSYCYSRSVSEVMRGPSMSEFGETASEFAMNVDDDHFEGKFSNLKVTEEDPWRNISILEMPIKQTTPDVKKVDQIEIPSIPTYATNDEEPKGKRSILIKGKNVIPVTPKTPKRPPVNEKEERMKNLKLQETIDEIIDKMPAILIDRLIDDKTKGNPIRSIQLDVIAKNEEAALKMEPSIRVSLASLDQLKALEVLPERTGEENGDFQTENAIKKYELDKLSKEKKNTAVLKKKRGATKRHSKHSIFIPHPKRLNSAKIDATMEDGFETEEEQPAKIPRNRGRELWMVVKMLIQKKSLVRSLAAKLDDNATDKGPGAKNESFKFALRTDTAEDTKKSIDFKSTPIYQYHLSRRALDMERFPTLYKGKKIDPETKELDITFTIRPVIGIAETERAKLPGGDLDMEKAHLVSIRNGVILNGYMQGSSRNFYDTVHDLTRRKASLTPADRAKYPTFDDSGPPVDSAGVPIVQKEGSTTPLPEIDLNEELAKVEILLADPQGVIPANLRKRAILLARLGKYARAVEDLNRAVALDPSNAEGLWHRHQQYLRINNVEAALADLDGLTDLNKSHFAAFQAKARIYQAIGLYKLAISNYTMVIRFRSENADAYHNRACLYEMEDDIILANEDFRSVRLLDQTNDQAIHNLAMYSFQRQLWSDCISEFTKLIHIDPENSQAYMYRGRSFAALSFYSEAMQDLTQAIRLSPDMAVYYFHRGCLLREQHIGKAIQDFSISILLDNSADNCDAYFYRAQLYQKQKHNELSILDYVTVIDLNPKKSRAFLNLGILYMKHSKNYVEALAYLNKGIATDQTNLRGYISRGELYEILYRQALLQQANTNTKRKLRTTTKLDTATNYAMLAIKDYSRAIHLRPCNYLLFLYRGRMLLKQGKVEEATIDFHAAFDLNSNIAQTFMQRALILSFQRKYKQIIEEYDDKKANQQLVRDPALLLLVAKARIRYGDFEGALADLNSVSDQARVDHQISLQKGICYEHLKNWSMASAEFSNCINQMPNFSKAYYHRGLCKLAEGESSGEHDLNKAIELDPKFFDAYVTRAAYYESIENFSKGIVDCDEALRLEPTSIRAHILRGSCKCKLNLYSLAIADFTKAVFIDKTSPFAFYNRAIAYQYAGEHYNAIKDYSIVVLLQDNMNAYKNRAMLYWKLGDNENALLDFLAAKNLSPNDPKLRSLLGLGLQKVGKYDESCVEFTVAMNLDGNMKEAILGRGNVYAAMGDLKKSRKDYSRVLHMYPRSSDTLINIAYTMQSEGRPKDAWRYFTMAYTIDPRCTAALKGRALVNSSTNNPFSAYLDITRAIEISPENAELLNNRGVIYESLEDNVSALQNYKLAIKADNTFGLAYYNAANHYLKQHSWEKAADYYTKAIEFDVKDHAALLNRGIALLMIKEYPAAKADFDLVLQLCPDSSLAYFNLGYLYSLLGKYRLAEETYTKVIELTPSDKVAYLCRAEARSKQGKWKQALEDHSVLL